MSEVIDVVNRCLSYGDEPEWFEYKDSLFKPDDIGEYISEALYRETYEELHLPGFNPVYLRTYVYENERESELVNVFACVGDFHPEPDPVELAGGRYWSMKEIEDCLGKSVLTPNFEGEFVQIRAELEALL